MLDQAHRRATDIKEIHIIFVEAVEEGTEFKCLEQLRINSTATFTTVWHQQEIASVPATRFKWNYSQISNFIEWIKWWIPHQSSESKCYGKDEGLKTQL